MRKKDSNWKVLSSKVQYENRFMRLIESKVVRPNGKIAPYYTLDRKSSFSIVIPIDKDGSSYLVGQYRFPTRSYSWEFPMGAVIGKAPLQMAKQELREETGIVADKWRQIGMFQVAPGHTNQEAYVFTARELTSGRPKPEDGEFIKIRRISFKKVAGMIRKGEILDGPTIAAFYFYLQYLPKAIFS